MAIGLMEKNMEKEFIVQEHNNFKVNGVKVNLKRNLGEFYFFLLCFYFSFK